MWFFAQLDAANPAYNIGATVQITGLLKVGILEESINEIVRRHEILRTSFAIVDGQPSQIIGSPFKLELKKAETRETQQVER